jgi:hypothetical protein
MGSILTDYDHRARRLTGVLPLLLHGHQLAHTGTGKGN